MAYIPSYRPEGSPAARAYGASDLFGHPSPTYGLAKRGIPDPFEVIVNQELASINAAQPDAVDAEVRKATAGLPPDSPLAKAIEGNIRTFRRLAGVHASRAFVGQVQGDPQGPAAQVVKDAKKASDRTKLAKEAVELAGALNEIASLIKSGQAVRKASARPNFGPGRR